MNERNRRPGEGNGSECLCGGDNRSHTHAAPLAQSAVDALACPRDAALALLNSGAPLTRKAGSFLGQLCVDDTPLTDRQADWLETLIERHLGPDGGAS